jgi:dTDP-4-dehydrorhamnose reductase
MSKITVIGAGGMLGQDLVNVLTAKGHIVTALKRADLDITNEKAVNDCRFLAKKNADWIVNCAAYTNVDLAESEPELARDINEEAMLNLAAKLMDGPRLIHISTDFVFNGTANVPYRESDPVDPINVYGQTKLAGENYVEAMLDDPIILRTSWLYGANGNCFPKKILTALDANKPLRVVSDQVGCPTSTYDLSVTIEKILQHHLTGGIYHACGNEAMNWWEFAKRTIAIARPNNRAEVTSTDSSAFSTAATRPKYSVMDTSKLSQSGINLWRTLDDNIREIFTK